MARFELRVEPCLSQDANFWILGRQDVPQGLRMFRDANTTYKPDNILASARVTWGGIDNPMLSALPEEVHHTLADDADMQALTKLFITEMEAARCGAASVLNRLGEVLIVRLMRAQIEAGSMHSNLIATLADPRLSRAVVAIHDRPDHPWRLESLADEAGLSPSRFADLFRSRMGQPPLSYLRNWRLILAKQDIERGDRIQRVAARYCYGSPEALSRAFSARFGRTPKSIRRQRTAHIPDLASLS